MAHRIFIVIMCLAMLGCGSRRKIVTKKPKNSSTEIKVEDKRTTNKVEELSNDPKDENVYIEEVTENDDLDLPETSNKVINSTTEYIQVYKDVAIYEMRKYGIPASITLAQGILESGSGRGRLAVEANNHFGIKCHEWEGKRIYHDDDHSQECFRKYRNASESFRDHSEFLVERQRYSKLFTLRKDDYKAWARELRRAGYATDKRYPHKLIDLIERYDLHVYDDNALDKRQSSKPEKHIVVKGDTLYSIARAYNLDVEDLKAINNLYSNELSIGQELIIKSNSEN